MINVRSFQTSLPTRNKAKSHTCTMNADCGRLLCYLLVLETHKVVVKVKLILRLLTHVVRGHRSHTAVMFKVSQQKCCCATCPLLWEYIVNAQQKTASLLTGSLLYIHSSNLSPLFENQTLIMCLLFTHSTIGPLFANILSSGFHTEPISINELRLNVSNTKHFESVKSQ